MQKKIPKLIIVLVFIGVGTFGVFAWTTDDTKETFAYPSVVEHTLPQESTTKQEPAVDSKPLPQHIQHDIPFSPQAPTGDWGEPYQEACEEASIVMFHAAISGIVLSPSRADAEIKNVVEYENRTRGSYEDTTAAETADIMKGLYGYTHLSVVHEPTVDGIKRYLADDAVILAPMDGQELHNPHFTQPGPPYHMLVVVGYDNSTQEFITNDPGTKYGEGYRYSYDIFMAAIHDWNGSKEAMPQGPKNVIVAQLQQ